MSHTTKKSQMRAMYYLAKNKPKEYKIESISVEGLTIVRLYHWGLYGWYSGGFYKDWKKIHDVELRHGE